MSEAKEREDIDCYRSGNSSQNQLKTPLMVKLVELCRLKNGILVISFLEPSFTLSMRKTLVRLRAMKAACTRDRIQK